MKKLLAPGIHGITIKDVIFEKSNLIIKSEIGSGLDFNFKIKYSLTFKVFKSKSKQSRNVLVKLRN